jgi:hypothetical protein
MFLLTSSKFKRSNSVPLKPRKNSKALKASWTTFTKNKTNNVVKRWKIKASGKISGKRPTRLLRSRISRLLS